jgi:hypothetical protein
LAIGLVFCPAIETISGIARGVLKKNQINFSESSDEERCLLLPTAALYPVGPARRKSKKIGDFFELSATDLVGYLNCHHLTALDRAVGRRRSGTAGGE